MNTERCLLAVVIAALVAGFSPSRADAQTAWYHLHGEASTTPGFLQLTTAGPDSAPVVFQTIDLRNQTNLDYVIKEFDTPAGVPGATGTIPSGSQLSFTVWMRTTTAVGTFFPRVSVKLNDASGTLLCEATGASGLTTTLSPITLSCTTATTVVMTASDRFYVWAGVRVGVTAGKKSVRGELALEGALNGNDDSRLTVPLPSGGPTITSLGSSIALAGQSVAINGVNFGASQGNGQVTFNGVPGAVTSWSTSTIIATVPVGASTGPVLVWLNSQPSNGVSVAVAPPPAISSITPPVAAIGQTVTIAGTAFGASQNGSVVSINGEIAPVTSWTDTSIVARVPAGASTGPLVVTVLGQSSPGSHITVTPPAGPASEFHLHKNPSTTAGLFQLLATGPDETSAAIQSVDLKNRTGGDFVIKEFDTPANIPGARGTILDGGAVSFTLWMKATASSGQLWPKARLRLNGASGPMLCEAVLQTALTTTLRQYSLSCPTSKTLLIPTDRLYVWVGVTLAAGPGNKTVKGELDVEGTPGANYDSRVSVPGIVPAPAITSVVPASGLPGQSVMVTGANFGSAQGSSTLTFNGVSAIITNWSDGAIAATVPDGATSGPVVVSTVEPSAPAPFTVNGVLSGVVTSSSIPVSGARVQLLQDGQTVATVSTSASGSYQFVGAPSGLFDLLATASGRLSQSRTGVAVPSGGASVVNFDLLSTSGIAYTYDELNRLVGVTDASGASARYAYDAVGNLLAVDRAGAGLVSVLSAAPSVAPAGATITIAGAGFSALPGQNVVRFNGSTAVVLSASSTAITAVVPSSATSGPIEVTSPSGTGVSPFTFAVSATSGTPTITSLTPSSALVGATITINGTNFDPSTLNNRVSFNGGPDVVPVAATSTTLSVVIPQAGPGRVSVKTPRGVAVSGTDFALDTDDLDGKPIGGLWRLVVGQPVAFTLPFGTEAVFLVDLTAGQRVDAKLTDVSPTQNGVTCNNSPNFAGLTLRLPDGRISLDLFSSDCNYLRPFVVPVTGTYSFLVFDDFHSTDVNATITIHEPVDVSGTTVINQGSRAMTLSVPGQKVRWTFQAVGGEPLHLSVGEYPLCGAIDVSIYAPDDSRIVGLSPCWSDQATVTAPVTGTYVLQAESPSGATGNAGVTLSSP